MKKERALPAVPAELFRQLVENAQDVLWMADLETGRFGYLSPAFESIWGRERDAVMADRELWLQSVDAADRRHVGDALARAQGGEATMIDYRILRPDGSMRWIRDSAFPIRGVAGKIERIGGIARDITDAHRIEQATEEALAQRDLLLRELNHRVKNNLQLITALLHLQAARLDNASMRAPFDQASSRVAAIAEIHASLHPTEGASGDIAVGDYLERLCGRLTTAFLEDDGERITLKVEANHARLDLERALPLGLIVNELVTNALKHAFPAGMGGAITVAFTHRDGGWRLEVGDTGPGTAPSDENGESGFGSRLVELLVKQIGGRMEIGRDVGTVVVVEVPA
jgi:PAS domain S-box-containing protein